MRAAAPISRQRTDQPDGKVPGNFLNKIKIDHGVTSPVGRLPRPLRAPLPISFGAPRRLSPYRVPEGWASGSYFSSHYTSRRLKNGMRWGTWLAAGGSKRGGTVPPTVPPINRTTHRTTQMGREASGREPENRSGIMSKPRVPAEGREGGTRHGAGLQAIDWQAMSMGAKKRKKGRKEERKKVLPNK